MDTHLDLPSFTNGGGVLLALLIVVLAVALGALLDARKPKCFVCGGRTRVDPARITRTTSGRWVLLCRVCHRRCVQ